MSSVLRNNKDGCSDTGVVKAAVPTAHSKLKALLDSSRKIAVAIASRSEVFQ